MSGNSPQYIAKVVRERLLALPMGDRVVVLADEVRAQPEDGGWWYVPVSIHRDTEHMGAIYGAMSQAERDLEEQKGISVLLVPRIIPFQKWQDVA